MRLTISKSIILMILGTINCIIKHNHGKNSSLQPPCPFRGPVNSNTVLSRKEKVIRSFINFVKRIKKKVLYNI